MDDVTRLRTRKERAADSLLEASERLKTSMDELQGTASLAIRQAVEKGMPESDVAAVRSAADLVLKATDVLAATLDAVEQHRAEGEALH